MILKGLQSYLVREKFTLLHKKDNTKKESIAPSNRLKLSIINSYNETSAVFIIRTKNMHSAVRMFSRMQSAFSRKGFVPDVVKAQDWEEMWDSVISAYDRAFDENLWVCIYRNGKPVFKNKDIHPFLDLIEKCNHEANDDYNAGIRNAEQIFLSSNDHMSVEYESNVALVLDLEDRAGRFGTVLRGAQRTQTFSFRVYTEDKDDSLNFAQCLMTASAFLEGIQLAFEIGTNKAKYFSRQAERESVEEQKIKTGEKRLEQLIKEIHILEHTYEVVYRPEKPNFISVMHDAEMVMNRAIKEAESA